MATNFRTLEGGSIETGFHGADTTKFFMGELPPIGMEQFSEYAIETIEQLLGDVDDEARKALLGEFLFVKERMEGLPIRQDAPPLLSGVADQPRYEDESSALAHALESARVSASNEFGNVAIYYPLNPFIYKEGKVVIADKYSLSKDDFLFMSILYLGGGMFGWSPDLGTYQFVRDAVEKLSDLLERRGHNR